ncbi:MAG: putative transposase [Cellvibrionaceae bacterium]|jgi:putative transposase
MVNFKGAEYTEDVILNVVLFYVRYAVSYRALEEIMESKG